ncbi:hypothetical protein BJ508DRAFT_330162 [Ascobolus immersus RN42]|uniref:Uncharacterized protein n=1 Tax=Ascobolus immersus RN42 TaxID=1160509 RepID=A0A3N4HZR4_ASCIM|nr:hypothetical protein BJ508DRAFT_330162 [Ascobolus immersus RN42]
MSASALLIKHSAAITPLLAAGAIIYDRRQNQAIEDRKERERLTAYLNMADSLDAEMKKLNVSLCKMRKEVVKGGERVEGMVGGMMGRG